MVEAQFYRTINRLRLKIRLSGLEEDEYKIIIYIENFILNYGRKVAHDTLTALNAAEGDGYLQILQDILQTQKITSELTIYEKLQ